MGLQAHIYLSLQKRILLTFYNNYAQATRYFKIFITIFQYYVHHLRTIKDRLHLKDTLLNS